MLSLIELLSCLLTFGTNTWLHVLVFVLQYLRFLQTIVHTENQFIRRCQDLVMQELVNAGEEVLIFYNDKASFNHFLEMMRSERNKNSIMMAIEMIAKMRLCNKFTKSYLSII